MRSTVNITDLLDKDLRRKANELGVSYKEILNRVVAAGLQTLESSSKRSRKYRVQAKQCGFREGVDLLHLNRLVDELDDERRKSSDDRP